MYFRPSFQLSHWFSFIYENTRPTPGHKTKYLELYKLLKKVAGILNDDESSRKIFSVKKLKTLMDEQNASKEDTNSRFEYPRGWYALTTLLTGFKSTLENNTPASYKEKERIKDLNKIYDIVEKAEQEVREIYKRIYPDHSNIELLITSKRRSQLGGGGHPLTPYRLERGAVKDVDTNDAEVALMLSFLAIHTFLETAFKKNRQEFQPSSKDDSLLFLIKTSEVLLEQWQLTPRWGTKNPNAKLEDQDQGDLGRRIRLALKNKIFSNTNIYGIDGYLATVAGIGPGWLRLKHEYHKKANSRNHK